MDNNLNLENATGVMAFLAAIAAFLTWPFKMFQTRKSAEKERERCDQAYLKRIEEDGSFRYIRPEEFRELKEKVEKSLEQGEKWQKLAKDWMDLP